MSTTPVPQKPQLIELNPVERKRTYNYPNGAKVALFGVTHLEVRSSGTHRLKTADQHLHIVQPGWVHIEIDADDWTL